LGVGATTEGNSRLRASHGHDEHMVRGRQNAVAKAQDPARREKIARARRGKPRRVEDMQPAHDAWRGQHHSKETRQHLSDVHRARGSGPRPDQCRWTAEEDDLVRTLPAGDAAARTGRTLKAIYSRRRAVGLPDGRRV
jgi:hypothetical protein